MKRILVVEDDARVCDVLSEFLTSDGYEVAVTHDGQAALDYLHENEVDLLIVDINMPVLGGASLVHILRTEPEWDRLRPVPIMVVSALWDVVSFDLGIQAGFAKPLKYDEVTAKVRELIGPP